MMCVGCKQAKPGGSFWENGEHWRFCKECRDRLRASLRGEPPRASANEQRNFSRRSVPGLRFEPVSRIPHGDNFRVVPSTQLPRSILRVIRQLGVRA